MAHLVINTKGETELHDVWGYDDINNAQAIRHGIHLTDEQCKEVLELLFHYHDANQGINWEVIQEAIDQVLSVRPHDEENIHDLMS
jgi:DNA-binding FrmR family transcriptional regulator